MGLYYHSICLHGVQRNNFTLLWSSSVFYQVFIAEEVDGVAEIPPWLTYRHFWGAFLNISLMSACFSNKAFF